MAKLWCHKHPKYKAIHMPKRCVSCLTLYWFTTHYPIDIRASTVVEVGR
jgi:hypothetical protein